MQIVSLWSLRKVSELEGKVQLLLSEAKKLFVQDGACGATIWLSFFDLDKNATLCYREKNALMHKTSLKMKGFSQGLWSDTLEAQCWL